MDVLKIIEKGKQKEKESKVEATCIYKMLTVHCKFKLTEKTVIVKKKKKYIYIQFNLC